jgi:hypothetical protein
MECRKEKNLTMCTCTYTSCSRWGICCECIAYHRAMDEMPGCYFTKKGEATYNRSIDFFIQDYQRG